MVESFKKVNKIMYFISIGKNLEVHAINITDVISGKENTKGNCFIHII